MAKAQQFPLEFILKAIDDASATFRRVKKELHGLDKPTRSLGDAFRALRESKGLARMGNGLGRIRTQLGGVLRAAGALGIGVGGAVAGFSSLVESSAHLADVADRIGITVDALAGYRHAATLAGVETDELDAGIQEMAKRMGEARAGGGELITFLKQISPVLAKQAMATTTTEEQFMLFADAISLLSRESDQLALADKVFGSDGEKMLTLLKQGGTEIDKLRAEYFKLAGPQEKSARDAKLMRDDMVRLKASIGGVKAVIVSALTPAFLQMSAAAQKWFSDNREAIAVWVEDFGAKLPGRIETVVEVFRTLFGVLETVVEAVGGVKNAFLILVGFMAAKLVVSVGMVISGFVTLAYELGVLAAAAYAKLIPALKAIGLALLNNPLIIIAAAIAAAAYLIITNWEEVSAFFAQLWAEVGDEFMAFFGWVKSVFLNFTPLGLIIKHWGPISTFFGALWGGIVMVFEETAKAIDDIVGDILAAADAVIEAARDMADFVGDLFGAIDVGDFGQPSRGADPAQLVAASNAQFEAAAAQILAAQQAARAKIEVNFENVPRGTRIEQGSADDADVDLTLGYASGAL